MKPQRISKVKLNAVADKIADIIAPVGFNCI